MTARARRRADRLADGAALAALMVTVAAIVAWLVWLLPVSVALYGISVVTSR